MAGHLPPLLALVVAVAGGIIAGGAYGFIPGFLKARTGAHEVITTLMLNGIAPSLAFLILGLIAFSGPPAPLPAVPPLIDLRTVRVDYGFVVALAMAVLVSLLLFRSTLGFEFRATGFSRDRRPRGRHAARPDHDAGDVAVRRAGRHGQRALRPRARRRASRAGRSNDLGYVAIALALLAGRRPSGVVVAAILYGALTTGAKSMVIVTGIPLALLTVIVAFAIMFVAAPELTRSIWRLKAPTLAPEAGATPPARPADSA